MQNELTKDAEIYCRTVGISLSTLAVRALNNSRFFDRRGRRIKKEEKDAEKLRAFMAENPGPTKGAV